MLSLLLNGLQLVYTCKFQTSAGKSASLIAADAVADVDGSVLGATGVPAAKGVSCPEALAEQRRKLIDATRHAKSLLGPRRAFALDVVRSASLEECLASELFKEGVASSEVECHEDVCRIAEPAGSETASVLQDVLRNILADGRVVALEFRSSEGAERGRDAAQVAFVRLGHPIAACGHTR